MKLSLEDAKHILRSRKTLIQISAWEHKTRGASELQCAFQCRVMLDGAMPRGLWFRCTTFPRFPNTASFQLECDIPGNRSHLPLYRLDWHPLSPHPNGDFGPSCLRGSYMDVGQTHEHICVYHADLKKREIRAGGVQTAAVITPDFGDFNDALRYVCDTLKIGNLGDIPPQKSQGTLV